MLQNLLKKFRKPKNPLLIRGGEALLQIDEKVYKLPKGVDTPNKFQQDKTITNRTVQLAKEYGINFVGFDYGIVCHECEHTSIYLEAALQGASFNNGQSGCFYKGREDLSVVCLFSNKKSKVEFMAIEQSCAVKDAFLRTLTEQGKFDRYLLQGIKPKTFSHIREFEQNNELEKKACEEYQLLKNQ
jgi:hypothetical protein